MALVIGNGPSREGFDLSVVKDTTFGCNALYRDFTPDFLVAVDKKMQDEIIQAGYHKEHKCIFHKGSQATILQHPNILVWDKKVSSPNNSGVAAVYHALKQGHKNIYIMAIDLKNSDTCNIYQGTENYKFHPKRFPKIRREIAEKLNYWITRNYEKVNFIRICHSEMTDIPDLEGFHPPYIKNITYDEYYTISNQERT